ncbi:hypothetical protein Franean1_1995 [Parafrankia sp. EAN1pec]|nr:hypothetical protein Franean1_1995 [Frankia sp. EAN1pec]
MLTTSPVFCRAERKPFATPIRPGTTTEVVFGESVEQARESRIGVGAAWLTMGSLDGKQVPDRLRENDSLMFASPLRGRTRPGLVPEGRAGHQTASGQRAGT